MNSHERVLDPLGDPKDGHLLTRAIIDTIREPLIILDSELRIIVASRAFYEKFSLNSENTRDKMFYDLGKGEWNIPALRTLLEKVIPEHTTVEGYEVTHDFASLGHRTLLINARAIRYENGRKKMLLSILDITDQRALEKAREELLAQKNLLLQEMSHRIANSLQLIASILLIKAQSVGSDESRAHLQDAHERVISIATVQRQLEVEENQKKIDVAKYLSVLCKSLARSMIGDRMPITITVLTGKGQVDPDTAVSLGLITTELVINAIKHAFPNGIAGQVVVSYDTKGTGWTLSVGDNGVGQSAVAAPNPHQGLGTSIVSALSAQLHARVKTDSSSLGTEVSIIFAPV